MEELLSQENGGGEDDRAGQRFLHILMSFLNGDVSLFEIVFMCDTDNECTISINAYIEVLDLVNNLVKSAYLCFCLNTFQCT